MIRNKFKIVTGIFVLAMVIYGLVMHDIWQDIQSEKHNRAVLNAENRAAYLEKDIEEIYGVVSALEIMLADGDNWQVLSFDSTAKRLMKSHPYIVSLQLAPQGKVTNIYPLQGNEAGLIDLLKDEKRGPISRYAKDTGETIIQGPFDLVQGEKGIVLRHPVYKTDESGQKVFWGFTIAIIKVPDFFRATIENFNKFEYAYTLDFFCPICQDWQPMLASGQEMVDPEIVEFQVLDARLKLAVMPAKGWSNYREILPHGVFGFFLVLLFTAMSYMLLRLAEAKRMFSQMSLMDGLTGLGNKRSFDLSLEHLVQEDSSFGLCYIDVNHFKAVNDRFGHNVGDALLKKVAKRIQENTSYPAYRIGGDEFVILVDEEVEEARYKQFKKNIDQAFAQRVRCLDKKLHITVSLGFARYPEDGQDVQQVISLADQRMYADKEIKHKLHGYDKNSQVD
ncbi:MAG: diguanylate cyclase domain-containing protein [Anaerovibrio sp.]